MPGIDVFISYAREDRDRVGVLATHLEKQGWSVWWDRSILTGESFDRAIRTALTESKCVIVLWSQSSIASDWVLDEASHAKERNVLVPALIGDVDLPLGFGRLQTARLFPWDGKEDHPGFRELSKAVRSTVNRDTPTPGRASKARQSLRAVVQRSESIVQRMGRVRWMVPAGFALVIVLLALVLRVPSARVNLELTVSELAFTSNTLQPITVNRVDLSAFTVSNAARIQIPTSARQSASAHTDNALRLRLVDDAPGSIRLDQIVLEEGTRFNLRDTTKTVGGRYLVEMTERIPEVGVSVQGSIEVVIPGALSDTLIFEQTQKVSLEADRNQLDIGFRLKEGVRAFLVDTPIEVRDLRVYRTDVIRDQDGSDAAIETSTVKFASLRYQGIDAPPIVFPEGTQMRFASNEGELTGIGLGGSSIVATFNGRVSGMQSGTDANQTSLMQTWFQRLTRQLPGGSSQ